MTARPATSPKLAHINPGDPALRQLHEEMTALGHILPARDDAPAPRQPDRVRSDVPRAEDFADVEDLFDNCPL